MQDPNEHNLLAFNIFCIYYPS